MTALAIILVILTALTAWWDPILTPAVADNTSYTSSSTIVSSNWAREGAMVLYKGGEGYQTLNPGSSGQFLKTMGETAPRWDTLGKLLLDTIVPVIGDNNTYGAENTTSPSTGWLSVVPIYVNATSSGLVSENITLVITATFSDNTTASMTKLFTDNSTYIFTATDMISIWKNGVYIQSLGTKAKSNATTHSGSLSVNIAGINF